MVCSQKSLFQCEKLCGNPLTCGNHQCQSICHLVTVPRCKSGEVQKPQVMSAIENGHNYNKCNTRFGTEYLTQEQLAQTNGVAEVDTCERCNLPCQKVTLLFKVLVLGDIWWWFLVVSWYFSRTIHNEHPMKFGMHTATALSAKYSKYLHWGTNLWNLM
jgi:hypothetical protein